MSQTFSSEQLSACIQHHVLKTEDIPSFTPIPTGKFNASYFVHLDGRELVLRIAPPKDVVFVFYERDMMRQEPGIHTLLLEKTTIPVAKIVAFDDSNDIIDRDFLLMERLPGEPLSSVFAADEQRALQQVGESLAQAHKLTAQQYGYLGEHVPMSPQTSWNDAFLIMWRALIEDVVALGDYTQEEADFLLSLLDKHLILFDRDVPSSLLHMDVWGQNILIDKKGKLSGLIDWDRALWGDPEIEFAVLDYCGISQPAFWEGYGQQRDQSDAAQTRNIFYLLYELQKYIVIQHGRHHNQEAARQYKAQVAQIIQQSF